MNATPTPEGATTPAPTRTISGTIARVTPRPPMPTAEFPPDELEQALLLARRSTPPPVLELVTPSEPEPFASAAHVPAAPAPETYGASSESRLGLASFPMQVAPRPVETAPVVGPAPAPLEPLRPVGMRLATAPSRGRARAALVLVLAVLLALAAAAVLARG